MSASAKKLRRGQVEEEDASQLKLGEEFQNAQCLFISEVKILLEAQRDAKVDEVGEKSLTSVFQKTMNYVQQFSRFTNRDTVREVRQLLSKQQLEQFEMAQIANLVCEDSDEAKALVPSLTARKDDDGLQALLNEMLTLKKFQS
ncbi:DNA-directed RNA polymerase II subunit RPB4 [Basidiobolus meristosporus CBS 931.73]|uniref:DNA-directed RNA polymerase II subunit RPB4 n=1 Tax=Basidiobolus meristosporus CBS 931.73 TaxID=1314790 RepID=A0A1Y1YB56_9FUNG|nr:DNA-directed RNA polymerase II subunit RPB4 [Basidiobolus meristosporus CBS 931.73]|eukprot:ORX95239.1 DNA-directed RNA polymerase II subunit RPB4 [Basidiobolus meristosporus CBS 931.73]